MAYEIYPRGRTAQRLEELCAAQSVVIVRQEFPCLSMGEQWGAGAWLREHGYARAVEWLDKRSTSVWRHPSDKTRERRAKRVQASRFASIVRTADAKMLERISREFDGLA